MTLSHLFGPETVTQQGRPFDPAEDVPAFVHVAPRSMPLPVLIAVPHAGRSYPSHTLESMRDPAHCTLRLEDRLIDLVGKEIAKLAGTGLLVANAPRAMLDLNRARDDVDWDMVSDSRHTGPRFSQANRRARSGLGLIPRRLPGFGDIWRSRVPQAELDLRIDQIHRPYHEFLARELERVRNNWGAALLVDLHSMPPLRAKAGESQAPDIVIGDRFGASCHGRLISRAFRYLDQNSCPAAHNRPYSGGYVLDRHSSPMRGIHALQIEVCRATYLDSKLSEPSAGLKPLASMLAGLVRELGAETARLGDRGYLPQAAE